MADEIAWLSDLGGGEYRITALPGQVQLGLKGVSEVCQNVWVLLRTVVGSSPLERDLGLPVNILDQPAPKARAILADRIPRQVAKWEPRARITRVDFSAATVIDELDGRIIPEVVIQILPSALEVD